MKVDLSCPIELCEYALPTEESPACSFTFFNLGQSMISSVQIALTFFDAQGEAISRRTERPMALSAPARERFTVEITDAEKTVDSVELIIEKVWFESGEEWRRATQIKLTDYTPNDLPPNRKLEHLRYVAGEDAVGYPSAQKQVWVCVCGRVNAPEAETCIRCERNRDEVFERFTPEAVQEVIDKRDQELQERSRQAREEASRQEFLRQSAAKRKRRARRLRTAILCTILVLGSTAYLFVVLGLPELKYQTAMSTLQTGNYLEARAAFENLMDYRDAAERIRECDFLLAKDQVAEGTADSLSAALKTLDTIDGYPGEEELRTEARYLQAKLLFDAKKYEDALKLFAELGDYRDVARLTNESNYQIARAKMDAKEYDAASAMFDALGLYRDAAALKRECIYRPAKALMAELKYDEAIELFAEVSGYSDADELRLQCIYQSALAAQIAGDYEYAAERFMLLGSYSDADEQMQRSIYLAANTARDAGSYETARDLYETVIGFEDAADQIKECVYLPAKQTMAAEDYAAAAEMFASIAGYKDADELHDQCIYSRATAHAEAEEYEEAIKLFEIIPEYSDVAKQLRLANYKLAGQMEAEGRLEEAAAAFEALGTYSDAAARASQARYAFAEEAFAEGMYGVAAERFEALGKYSDARTRVKECAYKLALMNVSVGELQKAYDELLAIENYEPAEEKAKEVIYALGLDLYNVGELMEAADKFELAGKYEDAQTRVKQCIYEYAQLQMDEGLYQEAGELFNQVAGYEDAKAKREECYDLWLAERAAQAAQAYDAGDYPAVLEALDGIEVEAMPRSYAETRTLFYDASLKVARQLIEADRALEAYSYLIDCNGYKNSATLLDKNIFKILGTWETASGVQYAFYLNGTCRIAGDEMYFNMPGTYGIETGDDADELTRTHSFVSGDKKNITLREDDTQKVIRLTRVRQAEVSYTEDSGPTASETEDIEVETDKFSINVSTNEPEEAEETNDGE